MFPPSDPWAATSQGSKIPGAAAFVEDCKAGCAAPGRAVSRARPAERPAEHSQRSEGETCISLKTPLRPGCFCGAQRLPPRTATSHTCVNEALRAPGRAKLGWAEGGSADRSLKQRGGWAEPGCGQLSPRRLPSRPRHRTAFASSGRQGAQPRSLPRGGPAPGRSQPRLLPWPRPPLLCRPRHSRSSAGSDVIPPGDQRAARVWRVER